MDNKKAEVVIRALDSKKGLAIEALKVDGVDMSGPAAVHRAMQVFAETVDQLEKLL